MTTDYTRLSIPQQTFGLLTALCDEGLNSDARPGTAGYLWRQLSLNAPTITALELLNFAARLPLPDALGQIDPPARAVYRILFAFCGSESSRLHAAARALAQHRADVQARECTVLDEEVVLQKLEQSAYWVSRLFAWRYL